MDREVILAEHKHCHNNPGNGVEGETCGLLGMASEAWVN